jgi:hypothetical protein
MLVATPLVFAVPVPVLIFILVYIRFCAPLTQQTSQE